MLTKKKFSKIMSLSLPIIGGALSQNLLNLVDTAMVGRLGNASVAAAGLGSFANFMSHALMLGLSSGVQAMASRRKGEGNFSSMAISLNSGLLISFLVAPFLSLILYFCIPSIVPFLNQDPDVIIKTSAYWQLRVVATVFVAMNWSFKGFFNGIDMPRVYMSTLVVMHIFNILLNYLLIFGHMGFPAMGVEGAAIASSLATAIGTCLYFVIAYFQIKEFGFLKKFPDWQEIKAMITISLPSGIQQLFFAAGFTALFKIIGSIGTKQLAAANILINIVLICILPGFGFGIAAATFVGQSLGVHDTDKAEKWAYDVALIGSFFSLIAGAIIAVGAVPILSLFIEDAETLLLAVAPLRLSAFFLWLDVAGIIFMNTLLGAGDSKSVMKISIFYQWFLFLPLAYFFVHIFRVGLLTVWTFFCFYRFFQFLTFLFLWRQKNWVSIEV